MDDLRYNSYPLSLFSPKICLTIGIVNPTEFPQKLKMSLTRGYVDNGLESYIITGQNRRDFNEPGKQPKIKMQEKILDSLPEIVEISPISVTLLRCPFK